MFTTRSLLVNGLKYIPLAYLLFISRIVLTASQQSCEVSVVNGVNFVCGDILPSYQPCSNDFELTDGKSTRASTLWLLGEYHDARSKAVNCLDKLTKDIPEHIVYVENTESGKEVACKSKAVTEKPGRKCIGWDDMAEKDKLEKTALVAQEWYPKVIENLHNILKEHALSNKDMDAFLSRQQSESRSAEKTYKKPSHQLRQIRAKIRVYDFLLSLRKEGYSYKTIFDNEMYDELNIIPESDYSIYKSAQKERNKKLIDTLSQASSSMFSVVLVGRSHVVNDLSPDDSGAAEYVKKELKKGKHQNHYAVLAMKN